MKYDTNLQILRRLMFCSLLRASFAIKRLLGKNCNSKLNLTEKRPRNKGNFLLYQKRLWHGKINSWMKTWKIQNQISKFKWHVPPKILGENISSYFEIDSGKLTEQIILEIFLGSTYVEGWPAGKIIGKHILKYWKNVKYVSVAVVLKHMKLLVIAVVRRHEVLLFLKGTSSRQTAITSKVTA